VNISNYKAKSRQLKVIIGFCDAGKAVLVSFFSKQALLCHRFASGVLFRLAIYSLLFILAFSFLEKMGAFAASPLYFSDYQALLRKDSLMAQQRTEPYLRVWFQQPNQIQHLEHIDENGRLIRSETYHYQPNGDLMKIVAYDSTDQLLEEKRFHFSDEEQVFLRFFFGEDFYAETEANFVITLYDSSSKPYERQLWRDSQRQLGMIRYFIDAGENEPAIIWYDSSRQAVREGFRKGRSIYWRRVWLGRELIDD
jgi:hypothetical protein